jgi:toxin-antitoxin system PIN domain toxin
VLLYAHREDAERHDEYRAWLEAELEADRHYGVSDLVLSSVLRIVTHQRIFAPPSPLRDAIAFCEDVRERPNAVVVSPGRRHWRIFTSLCAEPGARGNLVPDAYLAALAIETGSDWITTDRGYARFPGLRARHPLDA